MGGKGGIGKSLAAFLAAYLLGQLGPTLLVNADKKQVDGGVTELSEALKVPRPYELTESDDPAQLSSVRQLKQFRWVVTDNAPHRDEEKLKAAADADLVVTPMPPRRSDTKAVMHTIRTILKPGGADFRVLLSMVPHTGKSKAETMQETLNNLGFPTFATVMRLYTVHEMIDGLPALNSERANAEKAAQDARDYVNEVLAALGEPFKVLEPAAQGRPA